MQWADSRHLRTHHRCRHCLLIIVTYNFLEHRKSPKHLSLRALGEGPPAYLFFVAGRLRLIGHTHDKVCQVAVKRLTYLVQLFKADTIRNLMVQVADRVGAYACLTRRVSQTLGPLASTSVHQAG